MGLQFGNEKCEKMHIGKKLLNPDICSDFEVDIWKDHLCVEPKGNNCLFDVHVGKEKNQKCHLKKYFGQIV